MKIKTFKIRMTDELHLDEEAINQFLETVTIKKTATEFVPDKINYWSVLVYYEDGVFRERKAPKENGKDKIAFPYDAHLTNEEGVIFNALQRWRNDISIKTSLPGYMICNRSELVTLAKVRPKNLEELGKIRGFSSRKIMKYGDDVLALLNSV